MARASTAEIADATFVARRHTMGEEHDQRCSHCQAVSAFRGEVGGTGVAVAA
jgi:hypothetical protein